MSSEEPTLAEFVRHAERYGSELVYETAAEGYLEPEELGCSRSPCGGSTAAGGSRPSSGGSSRSPSASGGCRWRACARWRSSAAPPCTGSASKASRARNPPRAARIPHNHAAPMSQKARPRPLIRGVRKCDMRERRAAEDVRAQASDRAGRRARLPASEAAWRGTEDRQ